MATEQDKVNTGALATLVAVGAFAMIAISLALVALVRDQISIEHSVKDASQGSSYEELRKTQLAKLEGGLPITKAMADVVGEISSNPRAATPAGAPVPAPGAAPSPDAAATPNAAVAGGAGAGGASALAGGGAGGASAEATSAAGGASAGAGATDVELAPKPNRQSDGKLPPTGAAPVPAPKPSGGAGSEHAH